MGIKGIFGLCECKGCKNKYDFEMDITVSSSDGKKSKKIMKICGKHVAEVVKGGKIKNMTYEDTINF